MKIAHIVRYYPESPHTNGLEVAIVQLHKTLLDLGHRSEIIPINHPDLFKILENFDKVMIHFRRASALKVIKWCNKNSKSNYIVCHNGIGNIYYRHPNLLNRFYSLFNESHYLYRRTSGVAIFNSQDHQSLDSWFPKLKKVQAFWGVDQKRFRFVDSSPFYKKLELQEDSFLILCPGRIHPGKNLTLPLKIWDEISELEPKIHIVFMGCAGNSDYRYYKSLKDQADKLIHKNRIHWVEDISYGDEMLMSAYSAASIIIFPSFKESFGLVVLETAAVGKPMIASPVGVVPSLIKNGVNGFICDSHDPLSWKKNLLYLLQDQELRTKMGEAAKKEIEERYSWKESALKILEFIND